MIVHVERDLESMKTRAENTSEPRDALLAKVTVLRPPACVSLLSKLLVSQATISVFPVRLADGQPNVVDSPATPSYSQGIPRQCDLFPSKKSSNQLTTSAAQGKVKKAERI
jgi:hypothetical protein